MDAKGVDVITLKVLVDKKQNRVVFAEADKDFVDILFSFLTIPMSTIVKLIHKQSELSGIGCMATLYAGLENLDTPHFYSLKHKEMLLRPINSSGHLCRKLKFNIEETEPARYNYGYGERYLIEDNIGTDNNLEGVFVRGKAMFMISDDLKVTPMSISNSFELLTKLGVEDVNNLQEKILKVGLAEILSLLRLSFISKAPLTDLFLVKHVEPSVTSMISPTVDSQSKCLKNSVSSCTKMTLKIMRRKSDGKVLYAESEEDFVNYLLSILTIPLGAAVELLHSTPSLGCISNLYKSVEELSVDRHMKSGHVKAKLILPQIASQIGYKIQLLGMNEFFLPHGKCEFLKGDSKEHVSYTLSKFEDYPWSYSEPRAVNGFVEGPTTFIVTDDLIVTPLSSIANIFVLNKLNVSISDIDEEVVSFGREEALRLLEASLTSTLALTSAFNLNLKKPKMEK